MPGKSAKVTVAPRRNVEISIVFDNSSAKIFHSRNDRPPSITTLALQLGNKQTDRTHEFVENERHN